MEYRLGGRNDKENGRTGKNVNRFRNQIVGLTEQIKQKLKLIEKVSTEKSEIIKKKLSKENQNIKKNIEESKKSQAKAIDWKISKLKNLQEQNDHQKDRLVIMKAKLEKVEGINQLKGSLIKILKQDKC